MATYLIDVRHMDRYEIEADTADKAISRAKDCVADNYGALYFDCLLYTSDAADE